MKRLTIPLLLMWLLAMACQLGPAPATAAPPTATAVPATDTSAPATAAATDTTVPPTATPAPATASAAPTQPPTATVAPSTLRVAVRAADDSVQIVDTGIAAGQASLPGLLPRGGAAGGAVYVLDFKHGTTAQVVDASGTRTLDFVKDPTFGLAVWPGNGADKPRLAWGVGTGGPGTYQTTLFIADADGGNARPVVTETVDSGQPAFFIVAERWSADGQSLYFSREPSGIGGYIPFAGASSLYRYNLADQSVAELIPFKAPGSPFLCLTDLLPDASLAVGHCAGPGTIGLHPLNGGAGVTITAPSSVTGYRLAGSARFNPPGTTVAFALAKGEPTAEQGWVAVSPLSGGPAALVATSPAGHFYQVAAWLNDLTLLVQDVGTVCPTGNCDSVWRMSLDGSHPSKLADGDFLTLVGAP